jgi:UDP-N-acetylglucosamine 2-epimerase (non-hydrolysing)
MYKVDIIAGARPNFMKIAPIIEAIQKMAASKISFRLIHTGQHYDQKMSGSFFTDLGIPEPDVNLNAGGGSQAAQTGAIMLAYENLLMEQGAHLCLVVGDVTSTMACAIVAKKQHMKVAHVEAGIRSNDLSMPEEINRLVTDSITDYFFTTSVHANNNLAKQGIESERIFYVGNTMIDTLLKQQPKFRQPSFFQEKGLSKGNYLVMTLHRPANVDSPEQLKNLVEQIIAKSAGKPILFPVHPRTAKTLENLGIKAQNLHTIEPLGYLEFNYLVENSMAVITDSGGITEETTVMGIPCLTLRDNTERPETVEIGTNELIGTNPANIGPALQKVLNDTWKKGSIPAYWDGKTAERIVANLLEINAGV